MAKLKELVYDIETGLQMFRGFRLGEQRVTHKQFMHAGSVPYIICIAYAIDNGPVQLLTYDEKTGSDEQLIKDFDAIAAQADIMIGKNSDRFDVKHINTQRMLNGIQPFPEWTDCSEDVEKQIRKYFYLPSYSLDYLSKLLGFGGKDKMEFGDWEKIDNLRLLRQFQEASIVCEGGSAFCRTMFGKGMIEVIEEGNKALKKMYKYNKKDVIDTRNCLNRIRPYVKPRHSIASAMREWACPRCNGSNVIKNGTKVIGTVLKQLIYCNDCNMHCGKCTKTTKKNGSVSFGKITP